MFSLFKDESSTELPPLQLKNTESGEKEVFTPRNNKEVTLYTCGPTVYDRAHIGNLRSFIFADTLKRALVFNGYNVNHTMNYTDFGHLTSDADTGEDKMTKGLMREGLTLSLENMNILATKYIEIYEKDAAMLRLLPPTQAVRASSYIKEQIALIATLEQKGYAYETSDGLYFDVQKFSRYGTLGNIDIHSTDNQQRVDKHPEKRHDADFALWKKADLGYESTWGKGFPGWHVECSAMAFATLGKQIDIHTGGIDHIAIHHNAEIAQCECATGKQFAQYWLHNDFLTVDEEKIAKSAGNGVTLQSLADEGFSPEDFRYFLLQSHYRTATDFTFTALEASKQALLRLRELVFVTYKDITASSHPSLLEKVATPINDDLNTPQVLARLHEALKSEHYSDKEKKALLIEVDALLGLGLSDAQPDGFTALGYVDSELLPEKIQRLLTQREFAREKKDWTSADTLRDELQTLGYQVIDKDGVQVVRSIT